MPTENADIRFADLMRSSLGTLVLSGVSFGLVCFGQIIVARLLSPAEFGDFSIGMATVTIGGIFAMLGANQASIRFVPEYLKVGDWQRIAGFLVFFIPLMMGVALVMGITVWVLHHLSLESPDFFASSAQLHPVLIAMAVIPIYVLAMMGMRLLRAFHMVVWAVLPHSVIFPLVSLALILCLHWAGIEMTDWLVMTLVGVGFAITFLAEIFIFFLLGPTVGPVRKPVYEARLWIQTALPMAMSALLFALLHQGNLIMLELVASDEDAVGHFASVNATVAILGLVFTAILGVLTPKLGLAASEGCKSALQRLMGQGAGLLCLACGSASLVIILFAGPILDLFGSEYADARTSLRLVAAGYFINAALGLSRFFLQFLGHHVETLAPLVMGVILNLGLNAILVPVYGIDGAGIATLSALSLTGIAEAVLLYRKTGIVTLPFFFHRNARGS